VFGFPFFVKNPGENKCSNDVVWSKPNKSRCKRGDHEAQNPNKIDNGNQGDESIFNVVHGPAI
jgi:hypothetical protein